jgi:hypothetical protein
MGRDRLKEAYLRGFEEGLRQAWNDAIRLAARGYTGTEMGIIIKGKLNSVPQAVEALAKRLEVNQILAEEPEVEQPLPLAKETGAYLVPETKAHQIFGIFSRLTREGARGLCITRLHPSVAINRFSLRATRFVWLTRMERGAPDGAPDEVEFVSPTNLPLLASTIQEFLGANAGGVVLLEGLEYLVTQNDFRQVLRFVQTVNERVVLSNSYLLVSVNPNAMNPQDYELLGREINGGQ